MPEMSSKEYELYSKSYLIMFMWVVPGILLIISAFWLYSEVAHPRSNQSLPLAGALPVVIAAFSWWGHARIPQRIVRHNDGRIEFKGFVRSVILTPREIISIRPDGRYVGFLILKHEAGRLRLLNQFTGFHELLTYIESANPAVELLGC